MTSRFNELKEAWEHNHDNWREFEDSCWQFANQLRAAFAEYIGCELKDVTYVELSDRFFSADVYKFSLNRRMWIDRTGLWHFQFRTIVDRTPLEIVREINLSTDENKWLIVPFTMKKQDGTFQVQSLVGESRTFNVKDGDLTDVVEHTYSELVNWLENEIGRLVHDERGLLGFNPTGSPDQTP